MKIICAVCKTTLGEQKPFNDPSEIKAKCVACLNKEKEEARKTRPIPEVGKNRVVILENGWKGRLSISGKETDELSFWDLIVAGKKYSCSEKERDELEGHLNRITEEEVDVTFLHSITFKMEKPNGRKRRRQEAMPVEKRIQDKVHYNCTVRVPKRYVFSIFDDKADRLEKVAEILAEGVWRVYKKDQQKATQKTDPAPMSGQNEADKVIS